MMSYDVSILLNGGVMWHENLMSALPHGIDKPMNMSAMCQRQNTKQNVVSGGSRKFY